MHLDDEGVRAAGALMQSVDVLRDERVQPAAALEGDERMMAGVGRRAPGRVMEPALPREPANLGIRHVVGDVRQPFGLGVLRPEALRSAEVGDAGVRRDAGASQCDDARGRIDPVAYGVDRDSGHRHE